jgi:tyrosyl-tRNA synthetase
MSSYAFYQFWINRSDVVVPGLLRVFTFRSREEIEALEQQVREKPAARAGQNVLAQDVTTLVHGAQECAKAAAASRALFGQGELADLDERTLAAALAEVPSVSIERTPAGLPAVVDLLAASGIVESKSAARRAIAAGGAYLNNRKVLADDATPEPADLLYGRFLVLRRGKRTVGAVKVTGG